MIGDGSYCHTEHRRLHFSRRLQYFFERHAESQHGRERDDGIEIVEAVCSYLFAVGEHGYERAYKKHAYPCKYDAVQSAENDAERCRTVCRLSAARSEIIGDCRIYSDAETYADGIRKILKRINDGYGRHGVFADLCDEKTVDDIIERIDEHGYNHRQSHFQNKRQNRLFFHECLIHGRILPKSDFYDIICFSFGRLRKCRRRITERNSAYPAQGFG